MTRLEELEKRIREANELYYNDEGVISDEEYDALRDELKDLDPTNAVFAEVGVQVDESKEHWVKAKHKIPMGSQDKVNTIQELKEWAKNRGVTDQSFCVQEKLDGISISLNYKEGELVSAVTRGNGFIGEDIFRNARKMKGVLETLKLHFTGSIRGEVVLYKEDWQKHMPELSNPRNGASGVARRITGGGQEHLTVICYDVVGVGSSFTTEQQRVHFLKNLGFNIPNAWVCPLDEIEGSYLDYENGDRNRLQYEIDGLVIKINDIDKQEALGNHGTDNTGNPLGQVALKFAHEMRETIIESVTFEVGLTGRVTPVAWFKPVKIAGANILKASLHNITLMKNLGVQVGCTALISRRNDVIPYVEKILLAGKSEVKIPSDCPDCNESLFKDGEYLQCNNDECRAAGNIEKWINHVEIDDIGPKLVSSLVEHGLANTPADLYTLDVDKVASIERMGYKSAQKVLDNIQASKRMPLYLLLGSLNIQSCGRRVFKNIIRGGFDSLEKIRGASASELTTIKGIGPQLAEAVCAGLKKKSAVIDELLKVGVEIASDKLSATTLVGKSFCFTGSMSMPRAELQRLVTSNGGEIKNSVSGGLNYLVISDPNSTSSKAKKARSLGTKLINEKDLQTLASE